MREFSGLLRILDFKYYNSDFYCVDLSILNITSSSGFAIIVTRITAASHSYHHCYCLQMSLCFSKICFYSLFSPFPNAFLYFCSLMLGRCFCFCFL